MTTSESNIYGCDNLQLTIKDRLDNIGKMLEQEVNKLKFMASEAINGEDQVQSVLKPTLVSRSGMRAWGLADVPAETPLDLSKMTDFSYYNSGSVERVEKHLSSQNEQRTPRVKYF